LGVGDLGAVLVQGAARSRAPSRRFLVLGLAGVAGVALRAWVYRSAIGVPDSDEAVMGLMARHVLHGQLTTFYWGQAYGGSQEAILAAPLFAVAGSSYAALRLVPIVLSVLASLLVWRVGRRTIGEPAAGVAAALLWIWPPYTVAHLTPELGFYASNILYCALLLLLALRIVEKPGRGRVALFGLVLGLAFWQTAQIIPVALPIVGWTIWKRRAALRHLWLGVGTAAVGAAPWLVWNVRHDWASVLQRSTPSEYAHGLRILASPLLPMMLGLRAPLGQELLLPGPLTYAVYAGALALFAYGAVVTRARNVSILYAVAAVFPLIWPISHRVTVLTSAPSFLIVLSPVLALLVAQLATTELRGVLVLAAALVVSIVSIDRMDAWLGSGQPHWPPTVPRSLSPLVTTLDRLRLDRVYANYWIAYRLTFDTDEHVVAAQYPYKGLRLECGRAEPAPAAPGRYAPYQREVRGSPHGFVFFRSDPLDRGVLRTLARGGYRRQSVGPFLVYAPSSRLRPPRECGR
jgi:dolichyl-phosphate-mannose-protein mannosyltransferase